MSDPTDDFEAHMHAIGRVDDALRLLLRDFTGQGYSANDVIVMCRVVLERLEHEAEASGAVSDGQKARSAPQVKRKPRKQGRQVAQWVFATS